MFRVRRKSHIKKMKEMLSNRRYKKRRKNIPIDQQVLSQNKEEMELKREMMKKMKLQNQHFIRSGKHFEKRWLHIISFHSQCKWWLHHLTLAIFGIDRLIIKHYHIPNRQGVTLKVLLMSEKQTITKIHITSPTKVLTQHQDLETTVKM